MPRRAGGHGLGSQPAWCGPRGRPRRGLRQRVAADRRVHPGDLHLETAPEPVTECLSPGDSAADLDARYTTLCDPRRRSEQALEVVETWGAYL